MCCVLTAFVKINLIAVLFQVIATDSPVFSNHHLDQSAAINIDTDPPQQTDYNFLKVQAVVSIFQPQSNFD